jgi:fibro-slime domain-containing protein
MRRTALFTRLQAPLIISILLAISGASCGGGGEGSGADDDDGKLGSHLDSSLGDPDEDAGQIYTLDTGTADPDSDVETIPDNCGDGVRLKDSEEQCDDGNNKGGDGCSPGCKLELGYNCDPNGGGCMPVCGDGVVVGVEACDDMNTQSGDGCSATCTLEAGWACPDEGKACVAARCGDSIEVGGEVCDYGDDSNGDGCNDQCKVESGWTCGGGSCTAAGCGDGIRAGSEQCDDMNMTASDGCSADCSAVDPYFSCPAGGGACGKITHCGDGIFTGDERCDDGDNDDGDGCSATCLIEDGYACPSGSACAPVCGDGKVRGSETCDDANNAAPGCSASCQLESGYKCATPGAACSVAVCGNNVKEGLEECDDTAGGTQNDVPYDGCYKCKLEPTCTTGACTARCGDGLKFPSEACDDGNTRSGDGCNATCTAIEAGFACQHVEQAPPSCIDLPLILRDFKTYSSSDSTTHIDFNNQSGGGTGMVRDTLGADENKDGVLDTNVAAGTKLSVVVKSGASSVSTPGTFYEWYHDSARGKLEKSTMQLCDNGSGTYVFNDRTFYPLDGKGWAGTDVPVGQREAALGPDSSASGCSPANTNASDPDRGTNHNFGFTSEVRFWFTYKGGEKLAFTGDDDVWVFIAGKLVIDLGGIHCAGSKSLTLIGGNAVYDTNNNGIKDVGETEITLGLQAGYVYETVVFQAERHVTESSYQLSLGKFFKTVTTCQAVCGDGIRTAGELCDSGGICVGGAKNGEACSTAAAGFCTGGTCQTLNDGGYGHCGSTCSSRGAYCGDGTKDASEVCDNGAASNNGAYNGCNPNCTLGPRCGDGSLNTASGEKCDQGTMNQNGVYGVCNTSCQLGPRCGDSVVQEDQGEECDDGVNRASYNGCAPGCKRASTCGDGVVQANQGEQCDLGKANNTGAYGTCNADCSRAPYCGDKMRDATQGEECDDGNANNYDGCSMQCMTELILL